MDPLKFRELWGIERDNLGVETFWSVCQDGLNLDGVTTGKCGKISSECLHTLVSRGRYTVEQSIHLYVPT